MSFAVISESPAPSPFPSPSSSFIPPPVPASHDSSMNPNVSTNVNSSTAKRRSVINPNVSTGSNTELTNGHYYNAQSQRNSCTSLSPPSTQTSASTDLNSNMKRQSAPPRSPFTSPTSNDSGTHITSPALLSLGLPNPTPIITVPPFTPKSSFVDSAISNPPSPSRPAPPSPAHSRRPSRRSSRAPSRPQSGFLEVVLPVVAAGPVFRASVGDEDEDKEKGSGRAKESFDQEESPLFVAAAKETVLTPTPTSLSSTPTANLKLETSPSDLTPSKSLIIIRDYGFSLTDDRFRGSGPFVPKWNKLARLNRKLTVRPPTEGGEGTGWDRRSNREVKRKEKKKSNLNGWSDSGSDDNGESSDSDSDENAFKGSSAENGVGIAEEDAILDDEDDEDELKRIASSSGTGGWGGFRLGRMSWHPSSSSSGYGFAGSRDTGSGLGPGLPGFPSQTDFDRNFGQGIEYDNNNNDDDDDDDGDEDDAQNGEGCSPYSEPEPVEELLLLPGLYRALYAFEPEGSAEMGLEEDQVVRVVGRGGGEGWAVVVDTREGRKGGHALVPESYLELVRLDDEDEE
ncbi:hypothetical protein AX15_005072 [Amanita polypyramis BW_CC]|nr:hypothetical protein AX15_005072 [Amanita polypyramis BW_CC]